jgi:hypothetical protein
MVILLLPVTKITLDIQPFGHASIFVAFLGAAAIYCRLRRVPGAAAIALMLIALASRNNAISSSA